MALAPLPYIVFFVVFMDSSILKDFSDILMIAL